MLPILTTNVVFGFKSILKIFLNEFIEENSGFEGRTPFYLSDISNKTQKWSETRIQVRSAFLEGVSLSFSENYAYFDHFRVEMRFSKNLIFLVWIPLKESMSIPPENMYNPRIFFSNISHPKLPKKNFVAGCGPSDRTKTANLKF